VQLPDEYRDWARQSSARIAFEKPERNAVVRAFRLTSPRDGDRYEIPAGVDAKYATIALQVAGARAPVRWLVDGRSVAGPRWSLVAGSHVIRAVSANGDTSSARVEVLP
jgi:membrane carboxypeptidase/penicillin-binding protein PbpC